MTTKLEKRAAKKARKQAGDAEILKSSGWLPTVEAATGNHASYQLGKVRVVDCSHCNPDVCKEIVNTLRGS